MKTKIKKLPMIIYIDFAVFILLVIFPQVSSAFRLEIMAKCIVYMVLAMSLDLLWGYVGLMSMGHAVFFGIGGYLVAIGYSLQNGVPSFMRSLGIKEVPAFMNILSNTTLVFFLGLLIPALLAAVLGYFLFLQKVNGVFFSLITLAIAQVFQMLISNQQKYTGGANGITRVPRKLLVDHKFKINEYYFVLLGILLIVYLICRYLTNSKFGIILESIRENEDRMSFFGYHTSMFKIVIFAISGALAGLAGMLYTTTVSFISPSDVGISFSTTILVWLALGGRGNITGASIGTLIVCWAQSLLSENFSEYWMLFLGIIILIVVLFAPKGIVGQLMQAQYNGKASKMQNAKLAEKG